MKNPFPPPGFVQTTSAVEGIEVYMPAPTEAAPDQEVVEFNCPQCGATTAFSVADGGLTCSHCGYYEPPQHAPVGKRAQEYEFITEVLERSAQGWGIERKELECQNCGAQTSLPVEDLTHTCLFCGSNKVIQHQSLQDILRPRYLVPFKIEADACAQIAREWLGSSWMTPKSLKSIANLANFAPIYLPFWTFDATIRAQWKAEVGHQIIQRYYDHGEWKERMITIWRWESGQVQLTVDDLLVEGTNRLSRKLLNQVKPFNLNTLTPYEPKFLAGMQAKAFDVPLEKAWEVGRAQMREHTRRACLDRASSRQVRNFSMSLDFADESWRYILLPMYLTTYIYEDKPRQVMINGQTGTIAGQRPVDWGKVWLVIAMLLAPGVFLGLIGLLTAALGIGIGVVGVGFVLLMIGLAISIFIFLRAHALDEA